MQRFAIEYRSRRTPVGLDAGTVAGLGGADGVALIGIAGDACERVDRVVGGSGGELVLCHCLNFG